MISGNSKSTDKSPGATGLIAYCGGCYEDAMKSGDRGMAYFWFEAQNAQSRLLMERQLEEREQASEQ